MKLKALATVVAVVAVSASAYASPYYVGKNLRPSNNVTLGFTDTPVKGGAAAGGARGNIAAFELKGDYTVIENLAVGLNLPFYWTSKNISATGDQRASLGNIAINGNWSQPLSETSDDMTWGYSFNADAFVPTAYKAEGNSVANANPTTELFRYAENWMTLKPTMGLFVENEMFAAKTNVGLAYSYIRKESGAPSDQNRINTTIQAAASYKALPFMAINMEYNTMIHDKASKATVAGDSARFRHALTPSLSGTYESVMGQAFVNIPLDKPTRNTQVVSAGLNVGYLF